MSVRSIGFAALATVVLAAAPVAAASLDVDRAIALALENNAGYRSVEELRTQVVGGIREAKADAFPQLTLISSWGQSRNPAFLNSPDFGELLEQFPEGAFEPSTQELYRSVVEVSQPVFTFGKIGAAVDLAKIVADAAEAQISTAKLDLAADVAAAYYQVLAAREGLATLEAEREYRRRDLERITDLLEIGEATKLEELRARSSLVELEPEVASREGQVLVAEIELRRLVGLDADEPLELAVDHAPLPDPPGAESLVDQAVGGRPELDDLAHQASVYVKRQQITRADGRPRVDLTGSYGREVRLVDNFGDPLYDAWSFTLEAKWSLFDGGRRRGQLEQFESQRRQLELSRTDLESRIRLETRRALSDYETARARARSAELAAQVAREAVRVARENYEQGVATQTDLLDAQSRSTAADVLTVESYYDALIQASRLARAAGRIPASGGSFRSESPTS